MVRKSTVVLDRHDFTYDIKVDEALLLDCLKSHYRSLTRLIKKLFFDKDKPNCLNVKYDPKIPNHICIVQDSKWMPVHKDYFLDSVLLNLWTQLYDVFNKVSEDESFKENLACEETYQRIENFIEDFREFCNTGESKCWLDQKVLVYNNIVFLTKKIKP